MMTRRRSSMAAHHLPDQLELSRRQRRISSFRSFNPSLQDPYTLNAPHQSIDMTRNSSAAGKDAGLPETDWSEFFRLEEGSERGRGRETPRDDDFIDPWTGSAFASTSTSESSSIQPSFPPEPSPYLHPLQYASYEGRPAPSPHSPPVYRFPPPSDPIPADPLPAPEGYSSVMPPRKARSPVQKREEKDDSHIVLDASRKGKGAAEWLELDEADRAELTEKGSAAYQKAKGKAKVPRVTKKAKLEAARLAREGFKPAVAAKERRTGPKKSNDPDHVPRPPNAWILYRSEQIRVLKQDQETSRKPQSEISKLIGYMWREEAPSVKKAYEDEAKLRKQQHILKYPNYRFRPSRKDSLEEEPVPPPPPFRATTLPTTRGGSGRRRSSLPSVLEEYFSPHPFEEAADDQEQHATRKHTSASPPTFSRRTSLHLATCPPQQLSFYEPRHPQSLPYEYPSAPTSSTHSTFPPHNPPPQFDSSYLANGTWAPDPSSHEWFPRSPPSATPYYAPLSAPATTSEFQFPPRPLEPVFSQGYTTLPPASMEEARRQFEYEASRAYRQPYRPTTTYGKQMYEGEGGDQYAEGRYYAKQQCVGEGGAEQYQ